jgi:hypothetical protein
MPREVTTTKTILKKLYAKANDESPSNPYRWASSSCGRIEMVILYRDACEGYHSGQCDADIEGLQSKPYIKMQLDSMDKKQVSATLKEWFFDSDHDPDCSDDENNRARLLWIFCGDIVETESDRGD